MNTPKPTKEPENKDDYLFIANIEEFSELDLHFVDVHEVRGIDSTSRFPERLFFVYKSTTNAIWPLHRVLHEGFNTVSKILVVMKRTGGFTTQAKQMVLGRIQEIGKE